jgi:hypothetical protein
MVVLPFLWRTIVKPFGGFLNISSHVIYLTFYSLGSGETFYRRRDMVNRRNLGGAASTIVMGATTDDTLLSSRNPSPSLSSTVLSRGPSGYQNGGGGGGLLNPALLYRDPANAGTVACAAAANSCSCVRPEEDLNG